MKKLLISGLIILIVFLIYLSNLDKKIYYLVLGDSLALGEGAYGDKIKGYPEYVKDYLKKQNLLETYVDEYTEKGYRTTDLLNVIKDNKKIKHEGKKITLQNALIKADLVTLSIGANDILSKVNISGSIDYNYIYDYIDDLGKDMDALLNKIREYCKEDIILIGYYNPYPYLKNEETNKVFDYLNKTYKEKANKYKIIYIQIDALFKENPEFLPNENDVHPSKEGYEAIAGQIIATINKKILKP